MHFKIFLYFLNLVQVILNDSHLSMLAAIVKAYWSTFSHNFTEASRQFPNIQPLVLSEPELSFSGHFKEIRLRLL